MKTGQKGLDIIKQFEGFSSKPYLCPAGVPTIGYGATYYLDGRKVTMQDPPITQSQATALLQMMVRNYEAAVNRYVQVKINQNQFDALVSFAYNLGNAALQKSTLLKKLNAGDYQCAANEFLKWNRAGGRELAGLTRRRKAERALFLS